MLKVNVGEIQLNWPNKIYFNKNKKKYKSYRNTAKLFCLAAL